MLAWPPRTTREKQDYGIDWSAALAVGETIAAHDEEPSADDLVLTDATVVGTQHIVWVEGGSAGFAQIRMRVTTSAGRVLEETVRLDTTA